MLSLNKKKKMMFSILVITALALPVSVFTVNKIGSLEDTYAATMPSGFNDQNFYDCVLAEFQSEFPNETVASTGLTDEQLAKIVRLMCDGNGKSDSEKISSTLGIEKMSSLKMINIPNNNISEINLRYNLAELVSLYINGNPGLTFLDLSGNPALTSLHVDNIFVRTTLINPKSVSPNVTYDLSGVRFLKNTTQTETVGEQSDSYDWNTGILTIGNYEHSYVQVAANNNIYNFKLQLPLFMELDKNGGVGNTLFPICYTVAGEEECSTVIPDISLPSRDGYVLKGYADSNSATETNYVPGDRVSLSSPKKVYAVWEKDSADEDGGSTGDGTDDGDINNGDDDDDGDTSGSNAVSDDDNDTPVPSTSKKGITPDTGANTKTEDNSKSVTFFILPAIAMVVVGALFARGRSRTRVKFER